MLLNETLRLCLLGLLWLSCLLTLAEHCSILSKHYFNICVALFHSFIHSFHTDSDKVLGLQRYLSPILYTQRSQNLIKVERQADQEPQCIVLSAVPGWVLSGIA